MLDLVADHAEANLILLLARQSGDGQIMRSRGQRQARGREQEWKPHTTPHLRRNSHSEPRSISARKNTTGMSHRSFVSRVVIPASEYEISLASFAASDGV